MHSFFFSVVVFVFVFVHLESYSLAFPYAIVSVKVTNTSTNAFTMTTCKTPEKKYSYIYQKCALNKPSINKSLFLVQAVCIQLGSRCVTFIFVLDTKHTGLNKCQLYDKDELVFRSRLPCILKNVCVYLTHKRERDSECWMRYAYAP